jgi:hypothetical protein
LLAQGALAEDEDADVDGACGEVESEAGEKRFPNRGTRLLLELQRALASFG